MTGKHTNFYDSFSVNVVKYTKMALRSERNDSYVLYIAIWTSSELKLGILTSVEAKREFRSVFATDFFSLIIAELSSLVSWASLQRKKQTIQ